MIRLSTIILTMLLSLSSFAQGTVFFNNRTSTGDARVVQEWLPPPDLPLGPGYTAQLYLVNGSVLTPLTPTTTFREATPTTPLAAYFIVPLDVAVPGIPAGSPATFRMRVFATAHGSYEAATVSPLLGFGESNDVFVPRLGGITATGEIVPTPDLAGLQGFMVMTTVPEPSTFALGILGAAALLFARRSSRYGQ